MLLLEARGDIEVSPHLAQYQRVTSCDCCQGLAALSRSSLSLPPSRSLLGSPRAGLTPDVDGCVQEAERVNLRIVRGTQPAGVLLFKARGDFEVSLQLVQYQRVTGVPRSQETPPSLDPTVGLYLGSYGGPVGGGCFS